MARPAWLVVVAALLTVLPANADTTGDLHGAFATIRDFDFWTHNDPWARAIFTMIDAGRDGVPVLCNEIRDTDSPRLQRTIPIALREISDRRAIPFLIHALARCRPDTGNNGFSCPDGEVFWRIRRTLNPPVDYDHGIGDNRPEQVIEAALEALTGHDGLQLMYWWFGETGEWPGEWNEATDERKRQIGRCMADRWYAWWEANKRSLLRADELAWVEGNAPTHFQTPPASSERAIQITAKNESGAVKEYDVEVWADRERYTAKPDGDGRVKFNLPAKAERVTVVASHAGSIPLVRFWDKEHKPPTDYEIKFTPAVETSGVVNGADGKPLAGASVFLVAPKSMGENRWADVAFHEVKTDENGRWKTAQLPPTVKKLRVFVTHDKHATFNKSTDVKPLLDGTFKADLNPVFDVTGVVAGSDGKPIEGAKVSAVGEPYYEHTYRPVTTDAAGKFILPRVAATKLTIAAQAKDGRAWTKDLEADPKSGVKPLEIQLSAGRTIEGKIVDPAGEPIGGAIVQVGSIGGKHLIDQHTRSDSSGKFVIEHALNIPLTLEVFRSGYITSVIDVAAGRSNVEVQLKPVFHVSGSVTDARTGKPIDKFTYVQGVQDKRRVLYRNYQQHFTGGKYDRLFPTPHSPRERDGDLSQWYVRIEADGYMPQETRIFDESEGSLTFDFKLEPGESIAGNVVTPDGKPAAGAEVLLATATQSCEVYDGRLSKGGGPDRSLHVPTDANGKFVHRPQNEPFELVVIHDSGWARVMGDKLKGEIKLQPWGKIEGSVSHSGKPAPKARMTLSVPNYWNDENTEPRVQLFTSLAADAKGKFEFERVVAGHYRLSAQHTQEGAMGFSGPGVPIEVASGQALRIDFGGDAKRTVVGKLVFGSPQPAIDWSVVKLILSPMQAERKPSTQPVESTVVPVEKDGAFRVENVNSGAWQLMLDEFKLPPLKNDVTQRERTARGGTTFELPTGGDDTPLDLGEVPIQVSAEPLKAGMPAPPISAKTFDGEPFHLEDFRGRYVLLDFWATWCGPCVRETPFLKECREATRSNPRFAMIGLSLDNSPAKALGYTKSKGMDWTQVFLGMWGEHPSLEDYGVNAIPQIMLIGPDGNVIATDLRGEAITKTVTDSLTRQP